MLAWSLDCDAAPGDGPAHRELVAEELPVALAYNGISHAVMLATPADLLDIEAEETAQGTVLQLRISARCEMRLKERRRNLAGRTGCGLCGTNSLDQVRRSGLPAVRPLAAHPAALTRAMQALEQAQHLQALTGGVHAAGWCSLDGGLCLVREDVGRHNALGKLIGAMHRQRFDSADGFIAISSRASFEMVQKTAAASVGLLAAVSAPTGLAVRLVAERGVTLAGFVRAQRATSIGPRPPRPARFEGRVSPSPARPPRRRGAVGFAPDLDGSVGLNLRRLHRLGPPRQL